MKRICLLLIAVFIVPISYADSVVICLKGKVSIGDSLQKVKERCVFASGFQGGMRQLGKNNTITSFKIHKKILADGSQIRFLFLDDKLAFVFD